jgi:UDP-GlcNAc:undecaprenyl-phosphate/decaprenyl-phosphate GlcNAc-1-phosphate transferase
MIVAATGVALFLASFAIAALLLPLIERINRARGFTDRPGGRKDHPRAIPYGGGLAIFAAVAIPVSGGLAIALADREGRLLPAEIAKYFPGLLGQAPQILTILLGAALMLVVGWIDDWRGLSPGIRLAAQTAAATLLVIAGIRVTVHVASPAAHVFVTIVFVVFATNASNFIDNMNGLLGGVGAIQVACFLAIAAASGQLFVAAVLICLCGGLLAFLPRNFPRASVFLGDSGSLAVGFLIAAMTIACDFESGERSLKPIVMPLLILFVPLLDGLVVTTLRIIERRSPFRAPEPVRGGPGPPVASPDPVGIHPRARRALLLGAEPPRRRDRARLRRSSPHGHALHRRPDGVLPRLGRAQGDVMGLGRRLR